MTTTRKITRAQQAPSAHSVSEGPPLQSSQVQGCARPACPEHRNKNSAAPRGGAAPLAPLLQSENMTTAHNPVPSPLPHLASIVDPNPYPLPPSRNITPPALDKKTFNAPSAQAVNAQRVEIRRRKIAILQQQIRAAEHQIRVKVAEEKKVEKERKNMEEEIRKIEKELEREEEMGYMADYQDYLCEIVSKLKGELQRRSITLPSFAPPPQRRKYSSVDEPQDVENSARDGGRNTRRRTDTVTFDSSATHASFQACDRHTCRDP